MDKISKAKIIVVFTDIRGSSRWTRRMGEEEESRHAFMLAYDTESQYYRQRTVPTFYKRLADGRMFVHEMPQKQESTVATTVVAECLGLVKRVDRLILKMPSPRPLGFRIRIMAGTVINQSYPDGEVDWIGYVPNTCHKFLNVMPEHPLVVHESVKELISPRDARAGKFAFASLGGLRRCPDGVDREDLDALWIVTPKQKSDPE